MSRNYNTTVSISDDASDKLDWIQDSLNDEKYKAEIMEELIEDMYILMKYENDFEEYRNQE